MSASRPTKEEVLLAAEGARQLNIKLKLERELADKIKIFLQNQNASVFNSLEKDGVIPDAEVFAEELESILNNHYATTISEFSPMIIDQINQALDDANESPISKGDASILAALVIFMRSNVAESITKITETSNKEITFAISEFEDDVPMARSKLNARAVPRSESIGTTETQKAAEGSKSVTARIGKDIAKASTVSLIVFQDKKTWITRQDGAVRPAHDSALYQEVNVDEPFLVGGEELMYPGDTWLGASLWNVINCRCVSVYSIIIV